MGNTFSLFSFFLIVSIDKVLFSNIEMLLIKDGVQFFFFTRALCLITQS